MQAARSLFKWVCMLFGTIMGGLIGFWGTFTIGWLLAQIVEDQTSLGWFWILTILTTPLGALLGGKATIAAYNKCLN